MKGFLAIQVWKAAGIPEPVMEYRFHPTRLWRFDYAWPEVKVALESDGGVWIQGGHNRGSGWVKDTEKRNEAAALGWRLLRFQPKELCSLSTINLLKKTLNYSEKSV